MLSLLALAILSHRQFDLHRDAYGVAHIRAQSLESAFQQAGYAVALDRLWQMELSRRVANAQMAAIYGKSMIASDKETLATGYTDDEVRAQIAHLSPRSQRALQAYCDGVNAAIDELKASGALPAGYKEMGFSPAPWTTLDSARVAIRLFQLFGQGGAGEIRNLALLGYLQSRPNKAQALDIFDDFLWENDPKAPTTLNSEDDLSTVALRPLSQRSRTKLETSLAALPKVPLMELLPAIKIAQRETTTRVAENLNVPYKVGSYAIVVGANRSATGFPLLLSAPQMGHRTPSVISEISIDAGGDYSACGMTVPGVPGVAIGMTKVGAWALTSGVMDTTDIFVSPKAGDRYKFGAQTLPIESISFTLKVKGEPDQKIVQRRTRFGPIILESRTGNAFFSQRSTFWMKELESFDAVMAIGSAKSASDIESGLKRATVSFNCFYALNNGDVGYRYLGLYPLRAPNSDPRVPVMGTPENDWRGIAPFEAMPHTLNPKSGLLTNWNNKPAAWWNNDDTPVWGRQFRVEALRASLPKGKLQPADLEMGAWWIARLDPTVYQTMPLVRPALAKALAKLENPAPNVRVDGRAIERLRALLAFDGRNLEGSASAYLYNQFFVALRETLFLDVTGNFLTDSTFRTVAQPSVMLQALEGKTKVNYRRGRSIETVVNDALDLVASRAPDPEDWRYFAGKIGVPEQAPIPYSDRGSYIQVIEVSPHGVRGRNVVNPGVAESGPHSSDQVALARSWMYKAMGW